MIKTFINFFKRLFTVEKEVFVNNANTPTRRYNRFTEEEIDFLHSLADESKPLDQRTLNYAVSCLPRHTRISIYNKLWAFNYRVRKGDLVVCKKN